MPSLRAAPRPWLSVCTTRSRPSRAAYSSAILPEESVEPSSTTTTSRRQPVWLSTLSRHSGRKAATSYTGTTTLTSGSTRVRRRGSSLMSSNLSSLYADLREEPTEGLVHRRRRSQRHQHARGPGLPPRTARTATRGCRGRLQPEGVRRAAVGGRPPQPAPRRGDGAGLRQPTRRLGPDRRARCRRGDPRRRGSVAGAAFRPGGRAGGEGPAAVVV